MTDRIIHLLRFINKLGLSFLCGVCYNVMSISGSIPITRFFECAFFGLFGLLSLEVINYV